MQRPHLRTTSTTAEPFLMLRLPTSHCRAKRRLTLRVTAIGRKLSCSHPEH
jgi:hypothetical protein